MDRIKINLPNGDFSFSTFLTIRITDLNYGGHVGNDTFLSLAQEARLQFLKKAGYQELDIEGTGVIMVDAAIEYKRELKYGDEVRIWVRSENFDKLGFDIFYRFEVKASDRWELAAKIKTGMMCFDYSLGKKVAVPEKAKEKLLAIT